MQNKMTKIVSMILKPNLPFSCGSLVLKCWHLYQALMALAFIISFGVEVANHYKPETVDDYFDVTSPFGKEEKTAMDTTVQNINISLFMKPGREPLIAAITAEKPDNEINMWERAASITAIHTLSSLGQPFLAKLTVNDLIQEKCFAAIIHVYSWSRVIPFLEDEEYVVFMLGHRARVGSILTFQPLAPNITDIERLQRANTNIGIDGDSFVRTYFEVILGFEKHHIENVGSIYKYGGELKSINRAAAFLQLPQGEVFLSQRRKEFIPTTPAYSSGGLAFVFKKGSPTATDVSMAVLNLYEDGTLKSLGENTFDFSAENYILFLKPFFGIYLVFGATSTVCLLVLLINLIKSYCCDQDENEDNLSPC